jgi:hypothetical protein
MDGFQGSDCQNIVHTPAFVDSKIIGVPLFNFPSLSLFDERCDGCAAV